MAKASNESPPRRRGSFELLRQVYDELYTQLSEDYSPAELLKAAQILIDVTSEEYANEPYQNGQLHPGYFSFEVDRMIENQPWLIFCTECVSLNLQDDYLPGPQMWEQRLKKIYNPDRYLHRG